MINEKIINSLKILSIPTSFQVYEGDEETYITFFNYYEDCETADDVISNETYYIQIDVWSKNDYTEVVKQIKNILLFEGFSFKSAFDAYEDKTRKYRKIMQFEYKEEK